MDFSIFQWMSKVNLPDPLMGGTLVGYRLREKGTFHKPIICDDYKLHVVCSIFVSGKVLRKSGY